MVKKHLWKKGIFARLSSLSLAVKIVFIFMFAIVFSSAVIVIYSYNTYRTDSVELKTQGALAVAESVAALIDPVQYREIMHTMERNEYHAWLEAQLGRIKTAQDNIYVLHAGFLDDTAFVGFIEGLRPGEEFRADLGTRLPAQGFPAIAFDTMRYGISTMSEPFHAADYVAGYTGFIVAAYAPIIDEYGNVVGLVSVTILDTTVFAAANSFAATMVLFTVIIVAATALLSIWYIRWGVIKPLLLLRTASHEITHFLANHTDSVSQTDNTDIERVFSYGGRRYDEIGDLSKSIRHMWHTLKSQIITERQLVQTVTEKTVTVLELKKAILSTMAELVEYRDEITGGHIIRTQKYMNALMDAMKLHGVYADEISELNEDLILQSCQLHDIGKIAISDSILLKSDRLTPEEFEIMKTHTTFGEKVLIKLKQKTSDSSFAEYARIFAISHHERWDGSGYPKGLKGEGIPILGRMMAIGDVYDALVFSRSYKPAFSHKDAVEIISIGKGSHFDPLLVQLFMKIHHEFEAIAAEVTV